VARTRDLFGPVEYSGVCGFIPFSDSFQTVILCVRAWETAKGRSYEEARDEGGKFGRNKKKNLVKASAKRRATSINLTERTATAVPES
jgi:hypothetical protein